MYVIHVDSEADPAAVVPLLATPAAGHKGHCILVWAALPHPRRQEQNPSGHLRHPTVGPPASFAANLLRPRPLYPLRKLPLTHALGGVLLPQLPQLCAGHILRRHAGEGLGGQGAAQEALMQVAAFGIPQVGHLAPHTGFIFDLVVFMKFVDVPLDVSRQLSSLVLIGGRGAEGSKEELHAFGPHVIWR